MTYLSFIQLRLLLHPIVFPFTRLKVAAGKVASVQGLPRTHTQARLTDAVVVRDSSGHPAPAKEAISSGQHMELKRDLINDWNS